MISFIEKIKTKKLSFNKKLLQLKWKLVFKHQNVKFKKDILSRNIINMKK